MTYHEYMNLSKLLIFKVRFGIYLALKLNRMFKSHIICAVYTININPGHLIPSICGIIRTINFSPLQ